MAWSQDLATQWGLSQGLLQPGETATGGLLINRANAAGRGAELQNVVNQANDPNYNPTNGGVRSAFIEQMNPYEISGLSALGRGVDYSGIQNAYNALSGQLPQYSQGLQQQIGYAGQNLAAGANLINQGTSAITPAQISQYQNPYQQMVIDQADIALQRQADIARNKLNSSFGGQNRSFGDSSSAIQLSELGRNYADIGAQQRAALLNQGFNTALGAAQQTQANQLQGAGLYNQAAGVNLNAGGLYNQAANTAAGGYSTLGNLAGQYGAGQLSNIQGQIGAGSAIRQYNQGLLDAALAEYQRKQGYSGAQLDAFGNRINSINGGTTLQNQIAPNSLSQLGALGTQAGSIYNSLPSFNQTFRSVPSTGYGPQRPLIYGGF